MVMWWPCLLLPAIPSDSLVRYESSTSSTVAGKHDISLTAMASRGSLTGSAVASGLVVSAANKDLSVTLDGISASITLDEATYGESVSALAAHIQSKINGTQRFTGHSIAIASSGDATSFSLDRDIGLVRRHFGFSVSGTAAAFLVRRPRR